MEQVPQTNPIAERNDAFRQQFNDWYLTAGAQALPDTPGLVQAVAQYDRFTPDNDPYDEHDYGSFDWHTERVLWKIDYFDKQVRYWCDPLSDEGRCILTIMLASEY